MMPREKYPGEAESQASDRANRNNMPGVAQPDRNGNANQQETMRPPASFTKTARWNELSRGSEGPKNCAGESQSKSKGRHKCKCAPDENTCTDSDFLECLIIIRSKHR